MAVKALTGPYISAAGFSRGRSFYQAPKVKWLGVHTAEGARDEMDLGYFFDRTRNGSSQCGIGQDGGYCLYVPYTDTAWTNPPLNEESDTVELCGFAAWKRADWLARPKMLETFAHWLAWRASVRGIPLNLLSAADIRAGKPGIIMHRTVNDVYRMSSHWDPGYNLPWDIVLPRARAILAGGAVKPIPPKKPAWRGKMGWRRLENGMEGSDVREFQKYLNRFRKNDIDVDGKFGDETEDAAKLWQRQHDLEDDAIIGEDSQKKIAVTKPPTETKPKPPSNDPRGNVARTKALQAAVGLDEEDRDAWWGNDTDKRLHAVRMASNFHGNEFPFGVAYTQRVVGTKDDNVWGSNSEDAHDKTVEKIQKALGISVTGIWGDATDRAFIKAWREDAMVNQD